MCGGGALPCCGRRKAKKQNPLRFLNGVFFVLPRASSARSLAPRLKNQKILNSRPHFRFRWCPPPSAHNTNLQIVCVWCGGCVLGGCTHRRWARTPRAMWTCTITSTCRFVRGMTTTTTTTKTQCPIPTRRVGFFFFFPSPYFPFSFFLLTRPHRRHRIASRRRTTEPSAGAVSVG